MSLCSVGDPSLCVLALRGHGFGKVLDFSRSGRNRRALELPYPKP